MPRDTDWNFVLGDDLVGTSAEQLPTGPAVYVWRRKIAPPPGALERASLFCEWIQNEVRIPFLQLTEVEMTPSLSLQSLRLGGKPLSDLKTARLLQEGAGRHFRRHVIAMVQSLQSFAPNLYVGKAVNLRERIQQHLRNETDLGERLSAVGLTWEQAILGYWEPPFIEPDDENLDLLETLEAIVTQLTLGTLVRRVG